MSTELAAALVALLIAFINETRRWLDRRERRRGRLRTRKHDDPFRL